MFKYILMFYFFKTLLILSFHQPLILPNDIFPTHLVIKILYDLPLAFYVSCQYDPHWSDNPNNGRYPTTKLHDVTNQKTSTWNPNNILGRAQIMKLLSINFLHPHVHSCLVGLHVFSSPCCSVRPSDYVLLLHLTSLNYLITLLYLVE